jgi:hypothetical protein
MLLEPGRRSTKTFGSPTIRRADIRGYSRVQFEHRASEGDELPFVNGNLCSFGKQIIVEKRMRDV